jgi:hypothetical protein
MNAAGEAVVVWREGSGGITTLRSTTRSVDGSWRPPADIVELDQPVYELKTGIDNRGLAAAAWVSAVGSGNSAQLTREDAPGAWGPATTLNNPAWSVSSIDLGVAETGDVAVAWSEIDPVASQFWIHAQFRLGDGSVRDHAWVTTELIPGFVGPPSVGVSPDGSLVAVGWIDDGASQAFAATFARALDWSAPAVLGSGLYQNHVSVAAGPAGTAAIAWPMAPALEFRIGFRAATYDLIYPVPQLAAVNPLIFRLGTGPADIAATGTGFLLETGATSIVWDGSERPTDVVSSSLATGHLSAEDLATEGLHAVAVRNDAPGGGISRAFQAIVDGTAPVTSAVLTGRLGQNGWYTSAVGVNLVATDLLSGIQTIRYALDGSAAGVASLAPATASSVGVTSPKSRQLTVRGDGVHTLTYSSIDNAGVDELPVTQVIRVDTTKPLVTLGVVPRLLAAAPGSTGTVHVSATITDSLSTVDSGSVRFAVVDEYGISQPSGALVLGSGGGVTFSLNLDTSRAAADVDGRMYTITVSANNMAGLSVSRTVTVQVR